MIRRRRKRTERLIRMRGSGRGGGKAGENGGGRGIRCRGGRRIGINMERRGARYLMEEE